MEREKVDYTKKNAVFTTILFLLILAGIAVISIVMPHKSAFELENGNLTNIPHLTLQSFSDGRWATGMQDYVQNHMAGRDRWINLSGSIETSCFLKTEQNDILFGKDQWMFQKRFATDNTNESQFDKNVSAVAGFSERYGDRVTFMLVPSAGLIYADRLPNGAPQIEENTLLDAAFATMKANGGNAIDLRNIFMKQKENVQLYYKTDHHWTTDGAYVAYLEYCEKKGLRAFSPEEHTREDVSGFFGTHYSAFRWNCAQSDTLSYYLTDSSITVFQIDGENQFSSLYETELVNPEKLMNVDKYGAFLDGNHGYAEVSGSGTGKVLVVKDSYANCFVPFLTENYETIGVVDFRNFSYGLDSMIESKGYDEIIVLYNLYNFMDDNHVLYLNKSHMNGN